MRHGVGQVQKEGAVAMLLDELQGEFRIGRREAPLVGIDLDDLVVAHERQGVRKPLALQEVVVGPLAGEARHVRALAGRDHALVLRLPHRHHRVVPPHVVGERNPEPAVEPVRWGRNSGASPKCHFPIICVA